MAQRGLSQGAQQHSQTWSRVCWDHVEKLPLALFLPLPLFHRLPHVASQTTGLRTLAHARVPARPCLQVPQ